MRLGSGTNTMLVRSDSGTDELERDPVLFKRIPGSGLSEDRASRRIGLWLASRTEQSWRCFRVVTLRNGDETVVDNEQRTMPRSAGRVLNALYIAISLFIGLNAIGKLGKVPVAEVAGAVAGGALLVLLFVPLFNGCHPEANESAVRRARVSSWVLLAVLTVVVVVGFAVGGWVAVIPALFWGLPAIANFYLFRRSPKVNAADGSDSANQ